MKRILLVAIAANMGFASEHNQDQALKAIKNTITWSDHQSPVEYESHKKVLGEKEISKELRDWIEEIAFSMGDRSGAVKKLPIHKLSERSVLNLQDLRRGIISINYGLQTKTGIWLNTDMVSGDEIKYVATHELAHWILQHQNKKKYPYQEEFEADELALNTLVKLNKMDIVLNELINRNVIQHNYNVKELLSGCKNKEFKISYPTDSERALYYKKIIENLPDKKTDLPKSVLKKNKKLMLKQFCKPSIIGKIGCAAIFFYHSYQSAQEAQKVNKKIIKKQRNTLGADPTIDSLVSAYSQSKNIALISSGLVAGGGTTFLYPLIKTGRAARLFKKKGLI